MNIRPKLPDEPPDGLAEARWDMATGMAISGWSRHGWMAYRDRLGNGRVRSMAL
jgi:hypothetical protein